MPTFRTFNPQRHLRWPTHADINYFTDVFVSKASAKGRYQDMKSELRQTLPSIAIKLGTGVRNLAQFGGAGAVFEITRKYANF